MRSKTEARRREYSLSAIGQGACESLRNGFHANYGLCCVPLQRYKAKKGAIGMKKSLFESERSALSVSVSLYREQLGDALQWGFYSSKVGG